MTTLGVESEEAKAASTARDDRCALLESVGGRERQVVPEPAPRECVSDWQWVGGAVCERYLGLRKSGLRVGLRGAVHGGFREIIRAGHEFELVAVDWA